MDVFYNNNDGIVRLNLNSLQNLQKLFRKYSRFIPILIIIILLLFSLPFSFYTIDANEVGVVLRFGKFAKITPPGLHMRIPFGIDKVYPVKVEFVYKEEFGFRTEQPGIRTRYSKREYLNESLMLTGDLNVLEVEWIIQYKIKNPVNALFKIRGLRETIRDISESVMRKIVGDYSYDEILTEKRDELNNIVQQQLQEILDNYQAGVHIVTVKLQDVNPPDPVKPAFNEVNEAKQEKERLINNAWETYNRQIPQAKGEALRMIKEAEGDALEKINVAQGDTQRFLALLNAYKKNKEITLKRIYLEKMTKVLSLIKKKYIIDQNRKGILPLLNLEK